MASTLLALQLAAPSSRATEARVEMQGGESFMDGRSTSALFLEAMGRERPVGMSNLTWQPVVSLGWLDKRDMERHAEGQYATRRCAELIAGGARLHAGSQSAWYKLFFGFELAYNRNATLALGSHYEFVSTLGWQGKRFSFQLRHISNGGLHDPNRGETMALMGIGFTL